MRSDRRGIVQVQGKLRPSCKFCGAVPGAVETAIRERDEGRVELAQSKAAWEAEHKAARTAEEQAFVRMVALDEALSEVERLRAALEKIAGYAEDEPSDEYVALVARKALSHA